MVDKKLSYDIGLNNFIYHNMAIVLPFMERHEVDTLGITSRNDKNNKIDQIFYINNFIIIILFHVYSLHVKVYDFNYSLKLLLFFQTCVLDENVQGIK